jgi:TPR repeat protein
MLRDDCLLAANREIGMRRILHTVALLLLGTTVAHASDIYACKSVDGSATYQDTPCPKGATLKSPRLAGQPAQARTSAGSISNGLPAPPWPKPVNSAPVITAPVVAAARAPIDPATFSPAEWNRASGNTPWIPLPLSGGKEKVAYYAFMAHDYHAMLSIKVISARIGMVFETGRVDCHPGVDNDHLSDATSSIFDTTSGTRLIGDFLLDAKQARIMPGTVQYRAMTQVCTAVRQQHGEVSHPLRKGQVIKPDSNPSPLVSAMLAGLVEGNFHAGRHHDVHTTNCPLAHADSLAPPVPPFASTDIAQYVEQASSGDTGALKRLREAAANGNTLAAYKLGKMYGYGCHDGRGVTQDFGQAVHWYTIAANQGHKDSQESLSLMYSNGQGVPKDPAKAKYWRDKSIGQHELRALTIGGRKVEERDAQLAFVRMSKRAAQGDAAAKNDLGDMYLRGSGVTRDATIAMQWYSRAAKQGDVKGQRNLALMFAGAYGQPRDDSLMLHWLTLAARDGDAQAADRMGKLYYGGGAVLRDPAQAAHWFAVAADEGYGPSQYILATMYSRGLGVPRDDVQAIKWFLIDLASLDNLLFTDNLFEQSEARADATQVAAAQKLARAWWSANANKEQAYPK